MVDYPPVWWYGFLLPESWRLWLADALPCELGGWCR